MSIVRSTLTALSFLLCFTVQSVFAESTDNAAKVIDKSIPKAATKKLEVMQNIEQWGQGTQHWEHFKGSSPGEVSSAYSEDSSKAIENFTDCQDKSNQHNLGQIWTPAEVSEDCVIEGCCQYHEYSRLGAGHMTGLCLRIISIPPWCPVYFIWADLVEYYYPSYKVDVSEQMFQSKYLSTSEVSSAESGLKSILDKIPDELDSDYEMVIQKSAGGLGIGSLLGNSSGGNGDITPIAKEAYKTMSEYRDAHKDHQFTAPSLTKAYSRNTYEFLNLMTGDEFGMSLFDSIPHVPHFHNFATDMPFGYSFSKLFDASDVLPKQYAFFLLPNGERSCIRHNLATGKTTPSKIGNFESISAENHALCLDNIGEIYPELDDRRPHITDASYQAAEKNVEIYQSDDSLFAQVLHKASIGPFEVFGPHTYKREVDKWNVIGSPTFEKESKNQCLPIDKMTHVNTSYEDSNVKEARKGGENTFEIYPMYKGCWDFKGDDKGWIIFDLGSGKIPRGKLRLE